MFVTGLCHIEFRGLAVTKVLLKLEPFAGKNAGTFVSQLLSKEVTTLS